MPKHPFKILLCIYGSANLVTAKEINKLRKNKHNKCTKWEKI